VPRMPCRSPRWSTDTKPIDHGDRRRLGERTRVRATQPGGLGVRKTGRWLVLPVDCGFATRHDVMRRVKRLYMSKPGPRGRGVDTRRTRQMRAQPCRRRSGREISLIVPHHAAVSHASQLMAASCPPRTATLVLRSSHVRAQLIVAIPPVDERRHDPAEDEESDHKDAERSQRVFQVFHRTPHAAFDCQFVRE
jgi:hypothetical protein